MEKKLSQNIQHQELMMNVIKMMLELARKVENPGINTGGKSRSELISEIQKVSGKRDQFCTLLTEGDQHSESMDALTSLGYELTELNKHIQSYSVDSVASYMALKKTGKHLEDGTPIEGRTEMIAELGRKTTRILLDIKKKQMLLGSFAEMLNANKLVFASKYSIMFQDIQDACREYSRLLNQIDTNILAFSKYAGKGLILHSAPVVKQGRPQILGKYIGFINAQSRKLAATTEVFWKHQQLSPA